MKMTRDEKIAAGIVLSETKHNGHRRAFFHDYSRPGLYMITLVTEGRLRLFGRIVGHSSEKKGTENYPHLEYSRLGSVIIHEELAKISQFYPMVEVCKVALMPDHIHLLIKVREQLPHGKHLGNVVRGFKTGCTRAWWKLQDEMGISGGMVGNTVPEALVGRTVPEALVGRTVPAASPSGMRPVLFEKGYHDRILMGDGMLENICRYMDENPFRAKLREEHPNLMQRCLHLWIHDREYAAFGNLFLLKNPDRLQVFFHRKDKEGRPTHLTLEYAEAKEQLLQRAEEGAVLVTPGISKGEQGIVTGALTEHLPLILLQKEQITDYWKPSHDRFYACATGKLLILSLRLMPGDSDYERFHSLNDLAHDICHATDTRILRIGCGF